MPFSWSIFEQVKNKSLLLVLLSRGIVRLAVLEASETASLAATVGRGRSEAELLLRLYANDERRNGDHLLSDGDVALTDEDTGVVDGLSHTALEDLSLEAALEQIAISQGQDKIELVLVLIEDTNTLEAAEQSTSLEDASGIVGIEGEKSTGSLASLGKDKMHAPQLGLVLQTELSDQAELVLETLLLIRTTGSVRGTAVYTSEKTHRPFFVQFAVHHFDL